MTVYLYTPERLKQEIDRLVETRGIKIFVLSSDLHGKASAPSRAIPAYRIPCAIPEEAIKKGIGIAPVMQGFFMLTLKDDALLSEEAKAAIRDKEE